jgi:hypothetical protein
MFLQSDLYLLYKTVYILSDLNYQPVTVFAVNTNLTFDYLYKLHTIDCEIDCPGT